MELTDDALADRTRLLLKGADPRDQFGLRGLQYDQGLAWVHFPEGRGGLGLSRGKQAVVDRVLREGGVEFHDLMINPIGIGMGAPTVLTFGSEEMHDRIPHSELLTIPGGTHTAPIEQPELLELRLEKFFAELPQERGQQERAATGTGAK